MKTLTLFVTEFCNRKCSYCDISKLKKRKSFNRDLFKDYLDLINNSDFEQITLTGGEIGLLKEEDIKLLLSIDKRIVINTNGLFLKKYYDTYKDSISQIVYHPVSEINEPIPLVIKDFKIQYLVPIHKNNIYMLEKFLRKYSNITFELSPYDEKYDDEYSLSYLDFREINNILEKYKNVTYSTILTFQRLLTMTKKSIDEIRAICNNPYPSIDFTNGTIDQCVCSHTRSSKFPLTESNFKNIETLKFKKSDICNNCLSSVVWFNDILKNKVMKNVNRNKQCL